MAPADDSQAASQDVVDFRSDTVTRPTPAMRRAMAEAVVGDDVFGDDPTVITLEERAADAFGKEAGLFTPTGTMANLIAVSCHTRPGEEILLDGLSHIYNNEVGGVARFAGVLTRILDSDRGRLDPADVTRLARPASLHNPRTALLCLENTHNFHGGRVVPSDRLHALRAAAHEKGLRVHLDGARIWNAVAASGTDPRSYGKACDSLMFCFSKGLGAPVGSMLLGDRGFVDEARRVRKVLGGGMRQVGVLAAAACVALQEGPGRLDEDHLHARALAEGAAQIPGALVDLEAVETNIVFVRVAGPDGAPLTDYEPLVRALADDGVWAVAVGSLGVRFVTHRDVNRADVYRAVAALERRIPAFAEGAVDALERTTA